MDQLHLKPREERRILRGHLWAFRNEFANLPPLPDGALVEVRTAENKPVGRGFYQAEGGIAVRLLTRKDDTIDAGFLQRRIERARHYRERVFPDSTVYRWIYGESDELPGLIADRYDTVVTIQTACAFYGNVREQIAEAFLATPGVSGVRMQFGNDVHWHGEPREEVDATLNGLAFRIPLKSGQKTGFYLDQRENGLDAAPLFHGARVLDGHCYHGLWSCHAAAAGATAVLGVDSSQPAIDAARHNAERNGFADRVQFECADIQEALRGGGRYDVVLLDPPALAKSRAHTKKALGVYQAINRDALKAVESGGYVITSSCSHFVDMDAFMETIKRAARAARRDVWVLSKRGASRDHPVLLNMPETAYLKCVTLRVF